MPKLSRESARRPEETTPAGTSAQLKNVAGRENELATLLSTFESGGRTVVHLHGIPGIGKSTLLQALVSRLRDEGHVAVVVDCRVIEPTEHGLLGALRDAGVTDRARKRVRGIVALDNYEHLQLLDSWIREQLIPRQPDLLLLLATRRLPNPAWMNSGATFVSMKLDELGREPSLRALQAGGMSQAAARRAYGVTRGHPMALRLAISSGRRFLDDVPGDLIRHQVIMQLSDVFIADLDRVARCALEAMSTVRRTTRTVLAAMLDIPEADDLYEQLQALSVIERRNDGLVLHPTVQEAIAGRLRASDPARFTGYRRRAWRALEAQASAIAAADLWRYTADVIYLIDNPVVREAFFPSRAESLAVERARPGDACAILDLVERHDGVAGRALMGHWWKALPSAFQVVREPHRKIVGFYFMFDPARAARAQIASDPITSAWWDGLPRHLRESRRVLFLRRWLAEGSGDAPSAVQAACWLDIKRAYVEHRPFLQRVYLTVSDLAPYASAATELGFEVIGADPAVPLASAVLDFGPGSVDAWLRRLVRKELRIADRITLDLATREVVVEGLRTLLTPLECGVLGSLMKAEGALLRRDQIMNEVWGEKQYAAGSNVLDVVVLSLRKKLGAQARAVGTVRGLGYRFCDLTHSRG
jgi:hypothetical protein